MNENLSEKHCDVGGISIMRIIVDKSITEFGIKSIVIGIAKNVDSNAKLSDSFLEKQKKMEE